MGLCQKAISIVLFAGFVSVSTASAERLREDDKLRQADVCEMLKQSDEEIHEIYPNEYYDCHAHSRFFKLSAISANESAHHG